MVNASKPNWPGRKTRAGRQPPMGKPSVHVLSTPGYRRIWYGLLTLVTGCNATLPPSNPAPLHVPALPSEARPSLILVPSICSLTCTAGLTTLRETSRATLTSFESPAPAASAPTNP